MLGLVEIDPVVLEKLSLYIRYVAFIFLGNGQDPLFEHTLNNIIIIGVLNRLIHMGSYKSWNVQLTWKNSKNHTHYAKMYGQPVTRLTLLALSSRAMKKISILQGSICVTRRGKPWPNIHPSGEISLSHMDTHDGFYYSYPHWVLTKNCILSNKRLPF